MELTKLTHLIMRGKVKAPRNIFKYDDEIIAENDTIRRKRLTDLFSIYKRNASSEVLQLIQNTASTYSKLFITETAVQNQICTEFLDVLTKTLMVLAVIKRDYNTITSLINHAPEDSTYVESFFEKHLFIDSENCEFGTPSHNDFISTIWIHHIFIKLLTPETYSDEGLKLFGNLIMRCNESVKKNFEKAFESGKNMIDRVRLTENYYKIAKKFKEINIQKKSSIKLLSMGLCNDLTRLDNLRFKIDVYKNQIFDVDSLLHRISHVLIFLSELVQNKYVKLKCLAAARTCADETLAKTLEGVRYTKHFDSILMDSLEENLMNQLEFFATAIIQKISFKEYYRNKSFIASFDDLVHMNGKFDESNLKFYDNYPKTDRVKRPASSEAEVENQEEDEQNETAINTVKLLSVSEMEKIRQETTSFSQSVSEKFKNILNGFSNGFESFEDEIPLPDDLDPATDGKISESKHEKKPFRIDYELTKENLVRDDTSDCLKISDLCERRYNLNEIETVMYYFILNKKNIYSPEDFQNLNKIENYVKNKSNQCHAAIQYLIFKQVPEYSRLARIRYIFNYPRSFLAALLEHYKFEPHPGNYTYVRIGTILKKRNRNEQHPSTSDSQKQAIQEQQSTPFGSPKPKLQKISESSETSKRQPHKKICNEEDFHASDDLIEIFLLLESQIQQLINPALRMDASQAMNVDSRHKVDFILKEKGNSSLPIVIKTLRNQKTTIKEESRIELPCEAIGSLDALIEIVDKIVYDESNEPHIQTTELPTITGIVKIYGVTHFIKKMTIPLRFESKVSKLTLSLFSRIKSDTSRRVITPHKNSPLKPKEVEIKQEPNDNSEIFEDTQIMNIQEPEISIKVEQESLAYGDHCDFEIEESRNLKSLINDVKSENSTFNGNVVNFANEDIEMQSSPISTYKDDFEEFLPSHTIEISQVAKVENIISEIENELPVVQTYQMSLDAALVNQGISKMPLDSMSEDERFNVTENIAKLFYPYAKSHSRVVCVDFRRNWSSDVKLPSKYKYAREDVENHNNHLSNLSSYFNNLEMYSEIDLSTTLEQSETTQQPATPSVSSRTVTADSPDLSPPSPQDREDNDDVIIVTESEDKNQDFTIIIDD